MSQAAGICVYVLCEREKLWEHGGLIVVKRLERIDLLDNNGMPIPASRGFVHFFCLYFQLYSSEAASSCPKDQNSG